jgi:hypothetical protein
VPLRKLGFLTIGLFDPDDPATGHETTFQIIELGEQVGYDKSSDFAAMQAEQVTSYRTRRAHGLRAALQPRARRLRPDPHRHRRAPRPRAGLVAAAVVGA